MSNCKRFITLVAFIFGLYEASAQILVHGRLIESGTENAVPFASVSITNSSVGTASDEEGKFLLKVEAEFNNEKIAISSLGYQNRYISIDSLRKNSEGVITMYLRPFAQYLGEVVISGKRPEPDELLKEAIGAVPENYSQKPFNLEFYSKMAVKDLLNTAYQVETILLTYRKGYVGGAANWSKILHKRERGASPLQPEYDKKLRKEYFPYPPGFDISVIDQIGVGAGSRYTVFNPKKLAKMDFAYTGISVFDKDTVSIIEYSLRKKDIKSASEEIDGKYNGVIYIAINNLAIVRHTLKIGVIKLDIIYKKTGDDYFPYFIRTERPAFSGKKAYSLVHTISLRNIDQKNVEVIEQGSQNLHPEDVEFNKEYWDDNYPDR